MSSSARASDPVPPPGAPRLAGFLVCICALVAGCAAGGPGGAGPGGARVSGPQWTDPVTGIEFVRIAGGEFPMGSDSGGEDERPMHIVQLKAFYLGRHEVTQEQWRRIMGGNPSHYAGCDLCPVEQVAWEDVQEFLRRARERSGLRLRLPTEAEWEFAAGGGAAREVWPGTGDPDELPDFAWFKGRFESRTHPVGMKRPNAFGIHDMGGNVAEWCADWYEEGYYRTSPPRDPQGPATGLRRVVRGGSLVSGVDDVRTVHRASTVPPTRRRSIGFRVVLDAD